MCTLWFLLYPAFLNKKYSHWSLEYTRNYYNLQRSIHRENSHGLLLNPEKLQAQLAIYVLLFANLNRKRDNPARLTSSLAASVDWITISLITVVVLYYTYLYYRYIIHTLWCAYFDRDSPARIALSATPMRAFKLGSMLVQSPFTYFYCILQNDLDNLLKF